MERQPIRVFSLKDQCRLAWEDLRDGFHKWQIWLIFAYQDIKLRYRRSVLGPFWLTLSMAITVYAMGYLYSNIFHVQMKQYYPFLVTGILGWSLISSLIIDCTDAFVASYSLTKQIKLPYSVHIHRVAARNFLIFFHNLLVIVPLFIFFHEEVRINEKTLLIIPGIILIYINTLSFGSLLAMISARFNDMAHVIKNLMQILFFITPVMWFPDTLKGNNHFIVDLNPFFAFLECIREPLLGNPVTLNNLIVILISTLTGLIASSYFFIKYRARIIYWL